MSTEDYLFEVVVGVVRCDKRGFLLVRRSEEESLSGKWEFGGGAVEKDENLEDAVEREMSEETSLDVNLIRKGAPYFDEYSKGGRLKLHPFLLEVEESDEVELSHEHDDHEWLEIKEIHEIDTLGNMKALKNLGLIK